MPCSLLQPTGLRQNVDSSTGNRTVNRSEVNIGRNSRLLAALGCRTRCCTSRRGPKRESDARARPRSHKSLPSFWEKRRLLAWPPWLASSPIERCLRKPSSGVLAIIHEEQWVNTITSNTSVALLIQTWRQASSLLQFSPRWNCVAVNNKMARSFYGNLPMKTSR